MADYEARREQDGMSKKERNDRNNANTISNAADVAIASKNPYAMAAGAIVKGADKVTGGKSTKALGKVLTQANKVAPGGRAVQGLSNKLAESGTGDKIGKAASMYNSAKGGSGGGAGAAGAGANAANATDKIGNAGGGQGGSLPSSGGNKNTPANQPPQNNGSSGESMPKPRESKPADDDSKDDKKKNSMFSNFFITGPMQMILFSALPGILLMFFLLIAILTVSGFFSDYEDAIGISSTTGDDNGSINFNASKPGQQEYYDRVNDVKNSYQANGKTVDPLKIVAVFHVLNTNGAGLDYDEIDEASIREVADSMFSGNSYSEDTFKNNLINTIIPKYLPKTSQQKRESIAEDVFDYIERYYDLIGKNKKTSCSGSGSCDYDIKGFYIGGSGNIAKNIKVSDLKVRLMECGSSTGLGNGTDGKAIDGEELVNFEDYVTGVAYVEVGEGAVEDYAKSQLVAARSYALARPTAMGGAHNKKLEEENGQWILQIAACVSDQAYCNIDKGCSFMGGGDGQGGFSRSGTVAGAVRTKPPLAEDAPLRTYAKETEGEVLVNSQGYIIHASYVSTLQNRWEALAKSGLNYKQILLQTYNQGSYNFGATDIDKANCGGSGGSCNTTTGEYASWKQYEGDWVDVPMGDSGKTIKQIGCLATSISIQIARSGVDTKVEGTFNPGTFVQYLNKHGGFASGGNFIWSSAEMVAPSFKYSDDIQGLLGWSKEAKLNKIKELTSQKDTYVVAEVKGNTGQHWVAIDKVEGDTIKMMDPGSSSTDMWSQYSWSNTSRLVVFKVS